MKTDSLRRIASQRCFHHGGREAVAKCVACGRSYCRECVAEHDGRMICAACLRLETAAAPKVVRTWPGSMGRAALTFVAFFVAWRFFFGVAELLLDIPAPVHEGSIWLEE